MKYLKIDNNKGYFFNSIVEVNDWVEIDKITKEDLMILLNKAISEDFEMDEFFVENISHKAHQIVYKSIYEKLTGLIGNKTKFIDECDSQYKEAIEKYESADHQ